MAENIKVAEVYADFKIKTDQFNTELANARSKLSGFDGAITKIVSTLSAGALVGGLAAIGTRAIRSAADLEMLKLSFKNLLGSGSAADQLLEQIRQFAIASPFSQMGLAEVSKQLLAFRVEADQIVPVLTMLGNASQGNEAALRNLAFAFGQVKSKGKADMQDLYQFVNAGVPVFDLLAQTTGKTVPQIQKLVSEGRISYGILQTAIRNAYGEGGRFGGLMAETANTVQGKWSTLGDTIDMVFANLGQAGEARTKAFLDALITGVENAGRALTRVNSFMDEFNNRNERAAKSVYYLGRDLFEIVRPEVVSRYESVASVVGKVADGLGRAADSAGSAASSGLGTVFGSTGEAASVVAEKVSTLGSRFWEYLQRIRPAIAAQADMNRRLREGETAAKGFHGELQNVLRSLPAAMLRAWTRPRTGPGATMAPGSGGENETKKREREAEQFMKRIQDFGLTESEVLEAQLSRDMNQLNNFYEWGVIRKEQYIDSLMKLEQRNAEQTFKIQLDSVNKYLGIAGNMFSQLGNLFSQYYTMKTAQLDQDYQAQQESEDAVYEKEVQKINREIQNKTARDKALEKAEADHKKREAKAQADYEKKKAKLQREAAEKQKYASMLSAIINTAQAVTAALTTKPAPLGIALAAIVGAMGAAQVALIAKTPAMASGGYFTGPALIGEAGREFAFPLDGAQGKAAMAQMADSIMQNVDGKRGASVVSGGGDTYVTIQLADDVWHEKISRATRNRTIIIDKGAVA